MNIGVRWDHRTRRYEKSDLLSSFIPSIGKIVVAGDGIQMNLADPAMLTAYPDLFITAAEAGLPKRMLAFGDFNNFSPRWDSPGDRLQERNAGAPGR